MTSRELLQTVFWLAGVQAIGLAVLPLAQRVFGALPDRGYALARPLGLLLLGYAVWAGGLLGYLEYRRPTVILLLAIGAIWCWSVWGEQTRRWLEQSRRLILVEEAVFLSALLVGGLVRLYNPDIHGQEKFMDLAFFGGFLAATDLPAEDTWLSGYAMPYYPFGYLLLGLPARIAALPSATAYNLALVLVFALTVSGSAALVANLSAMLRPSTLPSAAPGRSDWLLGLAAAALVQLCGNLVGPLEILAARGIGPPGLWSLIGVKNLEPVSGSVSWLPVDAGWWWHASRVIPTIKPDGITEFPYFSFLLGDLHPHFTALPLLLLLLSLTVSLVLAAGPRQDWPWLLVASLALGAPLVANTWDAATFWFTYSSAALLVAWAARRQTGRVGFAMALAPLALGGLLYSPYLVGYSSQRLGLGLVSDRTPLVSLLIIFGPLLLLTLLLLVRLSNWQRPSILLLALLALPVALALRGQWTAALAFTVALLLLLTAGRVLHVWSAAPTSGGAVLLAVLGLSALAWGIVGAAELVYIHDSFGTRMNTVFKFYYHVWLLLAIAGPTGLALLLRRSHLSLPSLSTRLTGGLALALVLGLGLVYPLAATWTKSSAYRAAPTLDGAAFLARSRPGDAAAISWLAGQPGRPVVVEAVGGDYGDFARVSTFSGLPTVLGWVGHQLQWRGSLAEFDHRQRDLDALYSRAERDELFAILERYRARFVFAGSLERERYGPQVVERLGRWLDPVFQQDGTVVFAAPASRPAS